VDPRNNNHRHNTWTSKGNKTNQMSTDEHGPVQRLMAAVEHLSGKDDIPEGVYVDACNALKELHSITKLFKVTYRKFYVDEDDDRGVPVVLCATDTIILEQRGEDEVHGDYNWWYCFDRRMLPHDMSGLPINGKPFLTKHGSQIVVIAVDPYLKRAREEEFQDGA
jgi:hypothetical protein